MSVSSESEVSGEGDWQDLESDNESITIVSLFDAKTFTSTNDMLKHCKEQHDFDLIALIKRLQLDFHGSIKLVNFIRSNVKAGQAVVTALEGQIGRIDMLELQKTVRQAVGRVVRAETQRKPVIFPVVLEL